MNEQKREDAKKLYENARILYYQGLWRAGRLHNVLEDQHQFQNQVDVYKLRVPSSRPHWAGTGPDTEARADPLALPHPAIQRACLWLLIDCTEKKSALIFFSSPCSHRITYICHSE